MVLIRLITLQGLIHNVRIFAKHVGTKDNGKADALSRLQFRRFWEIVEKSGTGMNHLPSTVPEEIWPIQKIWIDENCLFCRS